MKPTPDDFRFWRDARATPGWAVRMGSKAVTTRADVARQLHAAINSHATQCHDPRALDIANACVFVRGVRERIARDGRAQVEATAGHGFRYVTTVREYLRGYPPSRGHHSTAIRNHIYRRWLRRLERNK